MTFPSSYGQLVRELRWEIMSPDLGSSASPGSLGLGVGVVRGLGQPLQPQVPVSQSLPALIQVSLAF